MISKYYKYGSNPLDMDDRNYTDKYLDNTETINIH